MSLSKTSQWPSLNDLGLREIFNEKLNEHGREETKAEEGLSHMIYAKIMIS